MQCLSPLPGMLYLHVCCCHIVVVHIRCICIQLREGVLRKEKLTSREETYDAIRKTIAVLGDPFTRFLEPNQYQALKRSSAGAGVTGVGLEVGFDAEKPNSGNLVVSMQLQRAVCCLHLCNMMPQVTFL